MVRIATRYWGELELADDAVVTFTQEILGFPEYRRYVLLPAPPPSPFIYIQSVDEPSLSFLALDPLVIVPDYAVPPEEAQAFGAPDDWAVLVLCTVSPTEQTANLRSPLVINRKTRMGGQVVLSLPYPFRQPLQTRAHADGGN